MTRVLAYLHEALIAIWRNRVRSVLTMLGMIIGTASIIGVLGISKAASGGISATLASFGDPGIIVIADPNQEDPDAAQIQFHDIASLSEATRQLVSRIVPNYSATFTLRANAITYDAAVSSDEATPGDTLKLAAGRRIDANDVAGATRVAVLSQPLYRRFFGEAPALGQTLRIGGSRFAIIGVFDQLKSSLLNTLAGSDYIEIPYTTFHDLWPGPVEYLQVFARNSQDVHAAGDAVIAGLRRIHGSQADYITQDASAQLAGFDAVVGLVATGLTAIGGVALLVAGIGIMNIMLVSVTERTREIGVRKSIGATRGDIFLQFLLEAVVLSLIGGGTGAVIGIALTAMAHSAVAAFVGPASVPYLAILALAVGFSLLVGTVFGTYPALRAGRMDPVEALRA